MYISEHHAAAILPELALKAQPETRPNELCVHNVTRLVGLEEQSANKVLDVYNSLDWITQTARAAHGSKGSMHNIYRLNDQFWSDVDILDLSLEEKLDEPANQLLSRTIEARSHIPLGHETDTRFQERTVTYLGGIALLAKLHKIKDYGKWLGEEGGWNAFVSVKALRPTDTE